MVKVTVRRGGQATGHDLFPADAEELLSMVDKHRHFRRGGWLETAEGMMISRMHPLQEGMVLVWHPPPPGSFSLMEVLEEAPPGRICTATSSSPHKPSSSSHEPTVELPDGFKLELWEELEEQVLRDIDAAQACFNGQELALRSLLETTRVLRAPDACYMGGSEEVNTNFFSTYHVLLPVNTVLYNLREVLPCKVHFQQGVTAELNRNPDFGLEDASTAEGILLACGEGKAEKALEGIHDIEYEFNHGAKKEICEEVVPQLYSYSGQQCLRYTWLTTYDRLWAVKMLDEVTMLISRPLHLTRQNPSVRQVLFWLALKAMGPDGKLPKAELPSQVPMSGLSGQGTQGGEAGPSSSGGPAHNTRSKASGRAPAPAPAPQGPRRHSIIPVHAFGPLTDLGHGESGTVSAGRLNGRDVAIKFSDCFNSKDVVRRLQHEADVYGRLQHLQGTCIPHLEGFGFTAHGTIYFLATRLIKGVHCKEGSAVSHAQRSAAEQALTAIHRAGFLHGDVRPRNLIFEEATGKAVFLDLGFSKACTRAEAHEAELEELRSMLTPSPTSAPDLT